MKKRIIYFIVILIIASGLFAVLYHMDKKYKDTDAYKFKKEYEKYNGDTAKNGKKYRKLEISEDNRMIYSTAKDIVKKIDNNESFIVYFGFPTCPWCRSMITNLVDMSIEKEVDIYYVNVLDIRDTKEYVDGEVKTTKEGDKYYMELLDRLDSVLEKYSLKDKDGNEVETNEKRIYAPNVVTISNGSPKKLVDGCSDSLEDPYGKITEEMQNDSIEELKCIFKCFEEDNVCVKPDAC